jgi:hypothetical protein
MRIHRVPDPTKADGKPVLIGSVPGPQGPPGVSDFVSVDLHQSPNSPFSAVYPGDPVTIDGQHANSNDLSTFGKLIGLALSQVDEGGKLTALLTGRVEDASWNWTKGDVVFLFGSGLSTSIPTNGYVQQVGIADGPKVLIVAVHPPIKL